MSQCSFVEQRNYKVIYRRYASLFFIVGVDGEEVTAVVAGQSTDADGPMTTRAAELHFRKIKTGMGRTYFQNKLRLHRATLCRMS